MSPSLGTINIDLPKLLETRLLVQSNSGGGKSRTLRRILEQTATQVQQLVIDCEGEFSSLREKFDYVICAPHDGDALATPQTAALLARRLLELGTSAILDIYDLKAHERTLFVKRFLDALINAPKTIWRPCMIVLDEAHLFAPQVGSAESLGSVIDIATRGRKRGFCLVAATQRLSKLHKDVAAELLNKLIGRTGLDVDVKRAADELGMTSHRDAVEALRSLSPGEFYVFGPAFSQRVIKTKIGDVKTSHPEPGQRLMQAPPAASAAILAQLAKLANLPKEAAKEAQTVDELRAQVTTLRRENQALAKRTEKPDAIHAAEVERRIAQAVKEAQKGIKAVEQSMVTYRSSLLDIASRIKKVIGEDAQIINTKVHEKSVADCAARFIGKQKEPKMVNLDGALPSGERAILTGCAQYPDGCLREQLSILTGYKRSTRDAYIARLRERGYIEIEGAKITATDDGISALGPDFEPLPTGGDLLAYWMGKLPEGECKVLDTVCNTHPHGCERDFISDVTGYKRSTRDAYILRLRMRQLISIDGSGVRASNELFSV